MKTTLKLFGLAFAMGFLIPSGVESVLFTDASRYDGLSVDESLVEYHLLVNETTNDFIDRLVTEEDPNVVYPNSEDECGKSNVSTYCLAITLNDMLTELELALEPKRSEGFDPDEDLADLFTIDDGVELFSTRSNLIEEEIEYARDTLDLTLAIYNQIQIFYPVHKELEGLYGKNGSLDAYLTNLAAVRDSVELYPTTFLDATTNECE